MKAKMALWKLKVLLVKTINKRIKIYTYIWWFERLMVFLLFTSAPINVNLFTLYLEALKAASGLGRIAIVIFNPLYHLYPDNHCVELVEDIRHPQFLSITRHSCHIRICRGFHSNFSGKMLFETSYFQNCFLS